MKRILIKIKQKRNNKKLKKAIKLFANKKYDNSFFLLEYLSERGCHKSNLFIGRLYYNGYILDKNKKKAFEYFNKSKDSDSSQILYNIGLMLFNGQGIKRDMIEGMKYFKKSAELGNFDAKANVKYFESNKNLIDGLGCDIGLYTNEIQ